MIVVAGKKNVLVVNTLTPDHEPKSDVVSVSVIIEKLNPDGTYTLLESGSGYIETGRVSYIWNTPDENFTGRITISMQDINGYSATISEGYSLVPDMYIAAQVMEGKEVIDPLTGEFKIYKDDNTTLVRVFQLKDKNGCDTNDPSSAYGREVVL
jgi:hypothetical protein